MPSNKYRVIVMGAAAVGKSCIINRFLYQQFMDGYQATIEDFYLDQFQVNGAEVVLEIVDTAGAYSFPAMRKLAISTGDAFILVYGVDDEETFQEVKRLRDEILNGKDVDKAPPIVVVANKVDCVMSARAIPKEEAETTANIDWNAGYVEVSAKDDINVGAVFHELLIQAKLSPRNKLAIRRQNTAPAISSLKKHPKLSKTSSCTIA
jgi:small GTP-binding protein